MRTTRRFRTIIGYSRVLAGSFGLDLEVLPHNDKDQRFKVDFSGEILTGPEFTLDTEDQYDLIDKRVGRLCVIPASENRINLIFGALGGNPVAGGGYHQLAGYTVGLDLDHRYKPRPYPLYCVFDTAAVARQPWSFLHELGHAAGAPHSQQSPNDLMNDGPKHEPITIRACHQLSQTMLATSWTAARKFRAVFS